MREQESPTLLDSTSGAGAIQFIQITPDHLSQLISKKVGDAIATLIQKEGLGKQTRKEILTREEVMNLLGVGTTTLHNWKKNKILVPFRMGNKVYYNFSDIEEYAKNRKE